MQPEINYLEIIQKMQEALQKRGIMRPIKEQEFHEHLVTIVGEYRNLMRESLRNQWEVDFPGVPFSEELLEETLEAALQEQVEQQMNLFHESLEKRAKFVKLFGRIFVRKQVVLFAGCLLSGLLALLSLSLIFFPSDFMLGIGIIGFFVCLTAFVVQGFMLLK